MVASKLLSDLSKQVGIGGMAGPRMRTLAGLFDFAEVPIRLLTRLTTVFINKAAVSRI
jgi:hypothetical protein